MSNYSIFVTELFQFRKRRNYLGLRKCSKFVIFMIALCSSHKYSTVIKFEQLIFTSFCKLCFKIIISLRCFSQITRYDIYLNKSKKTQAFELL